MKKRVLVLLAVTAMMVLMMALPEAALAEADVCVSIKGHTKFDEGASSCLSDTTSRAVAVNGSNSLAFDSSNAVAVNRSTALALSDCTVTSHNGGLNVCLFYR